MTKRIDQRGSRKRAVLVGLVMLGLTIRPACAADPIVIGVLNDESGPYADNGGRGSFVAAEMAAKDFGSTVLGRPIKVIVGDHLNKPDTAAAIASRWFDDEHVSMITELSGSAVALAVQHLAMLRGKITITTGSASTALIGAQCSPTGFMWSFNTYTTAVGISSAIVKRGGDTWSLIVADYAYGNQLASDVTAEIESLNGKVIGVVRYPFGATDFGSPLLTAQASRAKVIGLATGGTDLVNAVKQANEFGIPQQQALAALGGTMFDFHSMGQDKAQGLLALEAFYWNRNDETRAFSQRYTALFGKVPGEIQAATYSAVLQYLKALAVAGTDDGVEVAKTMRSLPVDDMFSHGGRVRADGWMDHDQYLVQVKSPAESTGEWDIYKVLGTAAAGETAPPLAKSACPLVAKL